MKINAKLTKEKVQEHKNIIHKIHEDMDKGITGRYITKYHQHQALLLHTRYLFANHVADCKEHGMTIGAVLSTTSSKEWKDISAETMADLITKVYSDKLSLFDFIMLY